MTAPKVAWRGRSDFAEIAEALGVTTDAIFAARRSDNKRVFVLYTPDPNEELIWSVFLKRDASGVFVQDRVPIKHPGMWDRIKQQIEEGFYD